MSLFDRFLATRGDQCNGSTALLTALTTLYVAIKVNEVQRISLGTLAKLSREQFAPRDIEEMEWNVLTTLEWKIHPPTSMSFVSHLLLLLPPQIDDACKEEIYSLSRYITELSVCDSAFVEVNPSSVAFAAILISLEGPKHRKFISSSVRDEFIRSVERHAELYRDDEHVTMARLKLTKLLNNSFAQDASSQCGCSHQTQKHPQQQHNAARTESPSSVTGSITGMQIQDQDTKTDDSSITSRLSQLSGRSCHSMSISLDSNMSANQGAEGAPVGSGSNANTMLTRQKHHDLIVQDLLPPPAIVACHP
jgi:hypothetical protein